MLSLIKPRVSLAVALVSPMLLSQPSVAADANAVRGTRLSAQWQDANAIMTRGADGQVIYMFGETQPTIVCAPLQLCEIQLQPGEVVRDVLVGDTVRWQIEPASSGSEQGQRISLIVKPAEAGLRTSMVVTTSRRTYHMNLESHPTKYTARVAFKYPENVRQQIAEANRRISDSVIPGAGVPAELLSFNFTMSGSARWKPSRIYTDGTKTYIQFPAHLGSGDAPVLYVVSNGQNQIVNYRLNNGMMVVDYVIDKAVLISGAGRSQQKIVLKRAG